MQKNGCINPQIMKTLAFLGHGDKILIADGNYPLAAKTGNADKVWLGLHAGVPTVTDVLSTLLEEINVESAQVMEPGDNTEPEIYREFRGMLPGIALEKLGRFEFYDEASCDEVKLAISTGEGRTFANILLTVGVA